MLYDFIYINYTKQTELIEIESRLVVASGWGDWEGNSDLLVGRGFLFGVIENLKKL